ncbi:hypothetical protein NIES4071_32010 [Calothrix sp. NIES-4071]|nr:hypothetical protein NIES4071_32010 [Calothrix sp. NIES-4071]BAZ57521.1 hypothetical protein NIES4105_31950 [Calothrix sp. NIES-4105]
MSGAKGACDRVNWQIHILYHIQELHYIRFGSGLPIPKSINLVLMSSHSLPQ